MCLCHICRVQFCHASSVADCCCVHMFCCERPDRQAVQQNRSKTAQDHSNWWGQIHCSYWDRLFVALLCCVPSRNLNSGQRPVNLPGRWLPNEHIYHFSSRLKEPHIRWGPHPQGDGAILRGNRACVSPLSIIATMEYGLRVPAAEWLHLSAAGAAHIDHLRLTHAVD